MECLVKNLNGTSDREPKGFNSWKEFWEDKKGKSFDYCSNLECCEIAEVGAHVQKVGYEESKEWYIVPLCKGCNNKSNKFKVDRCCLAEVTD